MAEVVTMKLTGVALAALSSAGLMNNWSMPLFNVPLTVIGMAAAGSWLSFAYGETEPNRRKLYTMAVANTFLATVCVAILPSWIGFEWMNPKMEAPLAGLFAFVARFAFPLFKDALPEIIKKFFKLKEYNDNGRGDRDFGGRRDRDYEYRE